MVNLMEQPYYHILKNDVNDQGGGGRILTPSKGSRHRMGAFIYESYIERDFIYRNGAEYAYIEA